MLESDLIFDQAVWRPRSETPLSLLAPFPKGGQVNYRIHASSIFWHRQSVPFKSISAGSGVVGNPTNVGVRFA